MTVELQLNNETGNNLWNNTMPKFNYYKKKKTQAFISPWQKTAPTEKWHKYMEPIQTKLFKNC